VAVARRTQHRAGLRLVAVASALLFGGCGSATSQTDFGVETAPASSYASQYPAQYREAYFRDHECGLASGYTMANCECQLTYIEARVPYEWLEAGSGHHAQTEEILNEAPRHCSANGQEN
jgi:hypothetical protein